MLLALVAAYLVVATLAIRRGWADRATVNILLVFALAFLAIVPLLLFDHPWCVVSWAALAAATAEAESRSGQRLLGVVSYLLLSAAACAGLFYYAPLAYLSRSENALAALSSGEYFVEFALRLVRLWTLPAAAVFVARRLKVDALAVASLIVSFLFFTGEARNFGYVFFPSLKTGMVSVAWLVAAFGGLWAGIVFRYVNNSNFHSPFYHKPLFRGVSIVYLYISFYITYLQNPRLVFLPLQPFHDSGFCIISGQQGFVVKGFCFHINTCSC